MSNLSYSFHICKDKNAIKTKSNLVRCSNHNMRVFCEKQKNNIFNHREYYNRMDIDDFVNIYQECKDDIVDKLINDNVDEFVEQQQKNKKKGMRM